MSRVLPILFNMKMVRAILDCRKSCTRRIIKPQPQGYFEVSEEPLYIYDTDGKQGKITPPYQPGDILYVRETFIQAAAHIFWYKADDKPWMSKDLLWKPSIHMPKEAARIWLKVTDVRVERLQEITEAQAQAEGIRGYSKDGNLYKYAVTDDWWIDFHNKHRKSFFGGTWWQDMPRTAKDAFSYLWNSTIKKSDLTCYGWNANPWVWVIEFERCEKPKGEN
ncbi:hypothetical protein [Agathobacter rectalis]|uniref:Uncharacterized protein n=1 Tax=Agathobacter rectalis TaxID=39491 RepID=A0A412RQU5_9FIRM|nr:hypothetical protein [Agathobacter rectalis]RGU26073.1 hypothetical protein DWW89_06415 [Agathobacter rectalis]